MVCCGLEYKHRGAREMDDEHWAPPYSPHYPALKSHTPSLREQISGFFGEYLGGSRADHRQANDLMSVLDLTPIGTAYGAHEAGEMLGRGYEDGNIKTMGLAGALLAASLVPGGRGVSGLGMSGLLRSKRAEKLDSKSISMYNLRDETPRPFEADYPLGGKFNEQGRLTYDIDGRPLSGRSFLVGRTGASPDNPFPNDEFNTLAKKTTGRGIEISPQSELGRSAGETLLNSVSRRPTGIKLSDQLTQSQAEKVLPHELGHALDQIAGEIPTKGLSKELKPLYNEMNTGQRRVRNLTGPQHLGYSTQEAPRELMAEAIRGYLTNPNTIKTIAPKTAKRIRKFVNSNPELKDVIQFNSIGGLALGGLTQFRQNTEE